MFLVDSEPVGYGNHLISFKDKDLFLTFYISKNKRKIISKEIYALRLTNLRRLYQKISFRSVTVKPLQLNTLNDVIFYIKLGFIPKEKSARDIVNRKVLNIIDEGRRVDWLSKYELGALCDSYYILTELSSSSSPISEFGEKRTAAASPMMGGTLPHTFKDASRLGLKTLLREGRAASPILKIATTKNKASYLAFREDTKIVEKLILALIKAEKINSILEKWFEQEGQEAYYKIEDWQDIFSFQEENGKPTELYSLYSQEERIEGLMLGWPLEFGSKGGKGFHISRIEVSSKNRSGSKIKAAWRPLITQAVLRAQRLGSGEVRAKPTKETRKFYYAIGFSESDVFGYRYITRKDSEEFLTETEEIQLNHILKSHGEGNKK
ncbi:MAG: hypothetical protein KJ923_01245 [Candidatus Omnitrophica bacterium]|nr:hypothetical protein [Candidatus Omnitrophota bacterium]